MPALCFVFGQEQRANEETALIDRKGQVWVGTEPNNFDRVLLILSSDVIGFTMSHKLVSLFDGSIERKVLESEPWEKSGGSWSRLL